VIPGVIAVAWAALIVAVGRRHRPVARCIELAPPAARRPRRSTAIGAVARRWAPTVAGGLAAWVLIGPVGGSAAVGLVVLTGRVRAAGARQRADTARTARLPDAIDLLVVAGAAGLSARHGLILVAERGPPGLRPAFRAVTDRLQAGEALAGALPRLIGTVGEPARGLVRAILTAERDGVTVRALLTHLADDARRQRRQRLEAAIRRLPVRLTFPIACCSLPAFVLLTVVPLLVAGLQRLGPVAI
jgi:tight adherence protein C